MPELSRSEWELMLVCWELGAPTAREVHAYSSRTRRRDYRTVLATLNNIVRKGFLRVEKHPGPRNIPTNRYTPSVSRRRAVERRIRAFLREDLRWAPEHLALLEKILAKKSR